MLGFLMSRHEVGYSWLPPPHFTTTVIPMSSTEVSTVTSRRRRPVSINHFDEGKISGEQDSFYIARRLSLPGYSLFGAYVADTHE
jgi:hypothetical protein